MNFDPLHTAGTLHENFFTPRLLVSPRHPWRGDYIPKRIKKNKEKKVCALRRNQNNNLLSNAPTAQYTIYML